MVGTDRFPQKGDTMFNQYVQGLSLSALVWASLASVTATASASPRLLPHPQQSEQTAPVNGDDLQYLARRGDAASQARLVEIFPKVKDASARTQAVTTLANWYGLKASDTLVALYRSMDDAQVKQTIVTELFVLGDSKDLQGLLTTEKDVSLHRVILQRLSLMSNS